jgi:putative tryptophan/tyrosine transport system substrate-binding protein
MTRRTIGPLVTFVLGLLVAPLAAEAQSPGTVPRIGVLVFQSAQTAAPFLEAFRQGLRELGYLEGQHIAFEWRYGEGRDDRLRDFAAELVQRQVDVLVTSSTQATLAAKHATTTTPIVFADLGDPVQTGLVASLARPGGNLTGLTIMVEELWSKRLELLKEALPGLTRVAALWNPANPAGATFPREMERAARGLGVTLHIQAVRHAEELDTAFAAVTNARAEALVVPPEGVFNLHRAKIAAFAAQHRLPAIYPNRIYLDAGGLMAYGPSYPDQWRRVAVYVDKILKGAKPADLPVEQPTTFELVINLKTAQALGLTIPPTLLFQATEVIR